jgi:hypothetical protein
MRNTSVTNALRWMLAAWMLLATSVMPSWSYGHSDGYFPNQHKVTDCTQRCSFAPTTFCGNRDNDVSLSADVHNHGSLKLLGSIKCSPPSGQPTIPHDGSKCSWCAWISIISAAQGIRISPKELTYGQFLLDGLTSALINGFGESNLHGNFCSYDALVFPLCDRARHERSGVQLA